MDTTAPIREFNAAIAAADLVAIARLITDDHRFVDPAGRAIVGRAAVLDAWRGFFAAFPGYVNIFDEMRAEGDTVCARGASRCGDPRLDGPALWRVTLRRGRPSVWEVFDDALETRARLGFVSG